MVQVLQSWTVTVMASSVAVPQDVCRGGAVGLHVAPLVIREGEAVLTMLIANVSDIGDVPITQGQQG